MVYFNELYYFFNFRHDVARFLKSKYPKLKYKDIINENGLEYLSCQKFDWFQSANKFQELVQELDDYRPVDVMTEEDIFDKAKCHRIEVVKV